MARTARTWARRTVAVTAAAAVVVAGMSAPSGASTGSTGTVGSPSSDPFYRYGGSTPLTELAPGTVLRTRTLQYHVAGIPLPVTAVQVLYRSTGQLGQATTNVTTVLRPPLPDDNHRAVSYQSFYDSLNPADEPSAVIAGGTSPGGSITDVESTMFTSFLLAGYTVLVPDTQGQRADFAAGPEYGYNTLDSIRAASHSAATGMTARTKVGLIGYSGGAIATGWAAALAPRYAPAVNRRLVGAAEGGVLVDPAHNLHYINGSLVWAGVSVMALIGVARAFKVSLRPYLNAYGRGLYHSLQQASITTVLGMYPGLTWQKIAKKAYPQPEDVPLYVRLVNELDLGTVRTPTVPMFIGQGANGTIEGTSGTTPGIGAGDGVMVAGDVRSLARRYCRHGVRVDYMQYDALSHFTTVAAWQPQATAWLLQRFGGGSAPSSCGSIAPGNSLAPIRAHTR